MKNEILKEREFVNDLFDAYGELLTEKQKKIFENYYLFDLSLSEIAEVQGITRSAVNDSLKKTLAKFEEYEEKVGVLKMKKTIKSLTDSLNNAKTNEEKEEALKALKEYTDGI